MRISVLALCLLLLPLGLAFADEEDDGARPVPGPRPDGEGPGGRGGGRGSGRMLERLKAMDTDGDGRISEEEFTGPARMWQRLDSDGDGAISAEEIEDVASRMGGRGGRGGEGGRGGPGAGRRGGGGLRPEALDSNRDNVVSRAELDAFFEKADQNGDGQLDRDEWDSATSGRALRDPAPKLGDAAPEVSAKSLATKEMVDLSAPKRTTVLVFGSHT